MIRAWWSWSIDAIYFMNDASYALYQEIFEPGCEVTTHVSAEDFLNYCDCWDAESHCDPNQYCANCGWTNPKITTLATGTAR
jgi:hypothetical protein